ncbi:MAG: DUF1194 domain-containing protein [Alphaproteobacteria bacterium]
MRLGCSRSRRSRPRDASSISRGRTTGRDVTRARDEAIAAGIGINGLPILTLEYDLDVYYRANVIGGPGAFVIAARSYEQFADAILKKLVAEIADCAVCDGDAPTQLFSPNRASSE